MSQLDSWQYGDPEYVAMRREEEAQRAAQACGDCVHHISIALRGEVVHFCEIRRRTYGRRCELFEIKKGE